MDISLNLTSPREILDRLAQRAKRRRLDLNLTQQDLAQRAQLSLGTLKLFERTGKASTEFLVTLAFALNAETEFDTLFPPVSHRSIEDVVAKPKRMRASRR